MTRTIKDFERKLQEVYAGRREMAHSHFEHVAMLRKIMDRHVRAKSLANRRADAAEAQVRKLQAELEEIAQGRWEESGEL